MGALIQAGQALVAGTGVGQLNQYYGFCDTTVTTVTAATYGALSTPYVIPANEAYQFASYAMKCGGTGEWGSTQEVLNLQVLMGGTEAIGIGSVALPISTNFAWWAQIDANCADGVNTWKVLLSGALTVTGANLNPGTAASNAIPFAVEGSLTAAVSSAITVELQAKWGSASVACTISNNLTRWNKVS